GLLLPAVLSLGVPLEPGHTLAQPGPATPPGAGQTWTHDKHDPLVLTEEETEDSYAIYSMLLKEEMKDRHLRRYAIEEWTGDMRGTPGDPLCLKPADEVRATYQDVFEDFLRKNRSRHRLDRQFALDDYLLLSPKESKHVAGSFSPGPGFRWSADDQKRYHDIHGIFTLSEVGFDHAHSRALVYIGSQCGSLCGGGTYHLLVKRDGKWQPDSDFKGNWCQWVS
ncbi:MAG TPA: hypothetical protein VJV74_10310, partial [Terriglobia bacterium]|nr:hypothetical protein [Terriglobia bacterium]